MQYQRLTNCANYAIKGVFALLLAVSLTRCTSAQYAKEDPEGVYQEAEEAAKDEHYLQAIEKYRELKNRYPYSSRAIDAELRIADAYFAQESYLEAESSYEIFKELHPTHPKSDYVQYQIALSYYYQIPSNSARDLSAAFKAIDSFDQLAQKFPNSQFVPKAKEFTIEARKRLAEHEVYVAEFYFRREHYLSASYRYSSLLRNFSNLGYDEEALLRLGECYTKIRMFGNAKDALRRLVTQFPSGDLTAQAKAMLDDLSEKN